VIYLAKLLITIVIYCTVIYVSKLKASIPCFPLYYPKKQKSAPAGRGAGGNHPKNRPTPNGFNCSQATGSQGTSEFNMAALISLEL